MIAALKKKLLIVEDEKEIAMIYKFKFQKEGFDVTVSETGINALNMIKKNEINPDVILLDIMLPGLDGLEAYKHFKDGCKQDSKVIILSNIDDGFTKTKAFALGVDAYLTKVDTTPKQVVEKVRGLYV